MRWVLIALMLVMVPASAQQDDSFWLKRVYAQLDTLSTSLEEVKDSQSNLRERLTDLKYVQQSQVRELERRVERNERALKNRDIKVQTREERIWEWVTNIVPPLIVMLIVYLVHGWWQRNVSGDSG